MNDELEQVKDLVNIAVLEHMANGKTKKDACDLAGTSVSTFDRALAENPTLATEFVIKARQVVSDRYGRMVETRAALIDDILDEQADAEKRKKMTISEKIALERYFRELQELTEKELGFLGGPAIDPKAAEHSLLKPPPTPVLRKVRGKISQTTTTEFDLELESDSIPDNVTPEDIVDGEIIE